jgi:hypothetical protein
MRAQLLLIASLLTTAWAGPTCATEPLDAKYYPLHVGNEWTYHFTSGGKTVTLVARVAKKEEIDGETLYRVEAEVDGEVAGTEHLRVTDEGIFRCRYNGSDVVPAVCVLKFPIKDGDTWESKSRIGKEEFNIAGSTTTEVVEVPFGKFAAAKVVIATTQNGMDVTSTYWFAPGVGNVKQVMRFGSREIPFELVDFKAGE